MTTTLEIKEKIDKLNKITDALQVSYEHKDGKHWIYLSQGLLNKNVSQQCKSDDHLIYMLDGLTEILTSYNKN